MPTYDYRCPNGHEFELFQRMSDAPGADCPECGAGAERQISAGAGFLFKGEGFYITDYRSDDYKKKASAEQKDGGGGAKSSPKGDAKADTPSAKPASGSKSAESD